MSADLVEIAKRNAQYYVCVSELSSPDKLAAMNCIDVLHDEIVRLRGEVEHWKTRARVNLSELDDLRARAEAKDVEVQSGCPACKLEAALAKQGS